MNYEISKRQARLWSRIGARATFGQAILELANTDDNMIAISADLGRSSGFGTLVAKHPNKFINAGIAEQNMIGVSAGFSKLGYNVYATSFAPFLSYRASEMIRMNLSYMKIPVNIVGLASGLALGFLGNSHFGLEDISIFRTFPDINIFSPADCSEIFKIVELTSKLKEPSYIRLTGGVNFPIVYEEDYDIKLGEFNSVFSSGDDVHIYATGSMVYHCREAAKLLIDVGCYCKVINVHTIRPFDSKSFSENCSKSPKLIVTAEEHFISGGLGSLVLEEMHKLKSLNLSLLKIGLPNKYLESGEYDFLLKKYELDSISIFNSIKNELNISV